MFDALLLTLRYCDYGPSCSYDIRRSISFAQSRNRWSASNNVVQKSMGDIDDVDRPLVSIHVGHVGFCFGRCTTERASIFIYFIHDRCYSLGPSDTCGVTQTRKIMVGGRSSLAHRRGVSRLSYQRVYTQKSTVNGARRSDMHAASRGI